jgi:hypothetical protein
VAESALIAKASDTKWKASPSRLQKLEHTRSIKSSALQAKLRIGKTNDIYEQEADRVAEQIMRMPDPVLQRICTKCDEDEKKVLQTKKYPKQASSNQEQDVPPIVQDVLHSPGQPLDSATRAFMEPRFGHDFSGVRVHTDAKAAESARTINALAFTVGRDVVLGEKECAPGTAEGKQLLAHELTHVIQQENGINNSLQRKNRVSQPDLIVPPLVQPGDSRLAESKSVIFWDSLPIEARRVLEISFPTWCTTSMRPKRDQNQTAEDCFNIRSFKERSAFRNVYNALTTRGIWKYIDKVDNFWPEKTEGLSGTISDKEGLLNNLTIIDPSFCMDTGIGGSQHTGASWREVAPSGTAGLHITINKNNISAHLDRLSPVARKGNSGVCDYSMTHILPHVERDLWGWKHLKIFPNPSGVKPGDTQPLIGFDIPGT